MRLLPGLSLGKVTKVRLRDLTKFPRFTGTAQERVEKISLDLVCS